MRRLITLIAASIVALGFGCGRSGGGGDPRTAQTATASCYWGTTCDQYTGGIDATFAMNLETTCNQLGVAFAAGACPTANQVAGHCDLGTKGGVSNSYFYYSPTYDGASAKADCLGNVVGVSWVP